MTQPSLLSALAEVQAIDALTRGFPRHPDQWNAPHEADAELVRLKEVGPDTYLAATIDGIANELSTGIYRDAYTAGWVLVMASLSDLAAVGAQPLGLLLALTLPPGNADTEPLRAGIDAALAASGVPVLGGDLNEGEDPHHTACALGLVHGRPIGRLGIRPGDAIWATGPLGSGNALATVRLTGAPEALYPEEAFRPRARLAEGQALRPFARALMDTSDGAMSTLDHLGRLNGVGFEVAFDLARLCEGRAYAAMKGAGLPTWPLVCGELGEYELIAAVAPEDEERLKALVPGAVRVATAQAAPGLVLAMPDGRRIDFDGAFIRNLPARMAGDWRAYAEAFQAFGAALGL